MKEEYHVCKITCDYCCDDIGDSITRIDIDEETKELKYHERILFMFRGDESFCGPECLITYIYNKLK